jgi:hypothetical protein
VLLERDCLIQRKICYHMPVLFKDLSYPLKYAFLFRICGDVTQKYSSLRESIEHVLYRSLQRQHTGGHYSNII